jgi:hypothetical protein
MRFSTVTQRAAHLKKAPIPTEQNEADLFELFAFAVPPEIAAGPTTTPAWRFAA